MRITQLRPGKDSKQTSESVKPSNLLCSLSHTSHPTQEIPKFSQSITVDDYILNGANFHSFFADALHMCALYKLQYLEGRLKAALSGDDVFNKVCDILVISLCDIIYIFVHPQRYQVSLSGSSQLVISRQEHSTAVVGVMVEVDMRSGRYVLDSTCGMGATLGR